MIPVFRPALSDDEVDIVTETLRSRWWGLGPRTAELESEFSKLISQKHCVGVNSGTSALHLMMELAGIGENDEVLMPSLTFVSCAHAVMYCGGKPVFVDVDEDTLTISPEDLRSKITEKTKAILCVHYGGNICDMNNIAKIATAQGLTVLEDCAHAAGSTLNGKSAGSFGDASAFSFHAVKNLATGDGGMVATSNDEWYSRLISLRWLGITKTTWDRYAKAYVADEKKKAPWDYDVETIGYKYHMNDLQASLGLAQLRSLSKRNQRRRDIASLYREKLSDLAQIILPEEVKDCISSRHLFVIRAEKRDDLINFLASKGIATSVHYKPIHLFSAYSKIVPDPKVPVTNRVWKELITLPMFPELKDEEVEFISDQIKEFYTL